MKRWFGTLFCVGMSLWVTGCAMCEGPFDYTYSAYGGVLERQDPHQGRVGSILSDPARQMRAPDSLDDSATEEDIYYEVNQNESPQPDIQT